MIVMPPAHRYRRPRRWETFVTLFDPVLRDDQTVLWERYEVPPDADHRHWWTVLDCDGRLLLAAGFHFINRIGFVQLTTASASEGDLRAA
jgi:hypothetical protein